MVSIFGFNFLLLLKFLLFWNVWQSSSDAIEIDSFFPATPEGTWSQEDKCCSLQLKKKNQTNHFQRKKRLKSKDKNIGRKNMSVVGEKSLFMTRVLRSSKCLGRNIVCDLHFHCPWSPIQKNIPLPDLKIYIELLFKKMENNHFFFKM